VVLQLLQPPVEVVRIYRFEEDLDQLRQTDPFPWRDLAARGCRHSCRIAAVKSPAPRTGGKASGTTRSRREGMRRSRHGRDTAVSRTEGEFDGLAAQGFGLTFECQPHGNCRAVPRPARAPGGVCPTGPLQRGDPAAFAAFAGNYQQSLTFPPQKI